MFNFSLPSADERIEAASIRAQQDIDYVVDRTRRLMSMPRGGYRPQPVTDVPRDNHKYCICGRAI